MHHPNNNLHHKKIGIWGFGIVGKSAFNYVRQFTDNIQILDQKAVELENNITASCIKETPENILNFLEYNDIIIPSPGIILTSYKKYAHKFVYELDLFSQNFNGKIIAITGTVGKTTLTKFIHECIPNSVAAGNIGHAMLDLLSLKSQPHTAILELSSYQLHYSKNFTPDLAIWNNFYPNHLDHHTTLDDYFAAKCNMLRFQTPNQTTLIAYELINDIEKNIKITSQIFLFTLQKPAQLSRHPIFYVQNNSVILQNHGLEHIILKNFDTLPHSTFKQNWLTVVAALYLQGICLKSIFTKAHNFAPQEHRTEFVRNWRGINIYNDSKSTVWQATKEAINLFEQEKIALFLGGIGKGTDRSPLFEYLTKKQVTIFCFGKEAEILASLCAQHQVPYKKATTLQEAVDQFVTIHHQFTVLLFSPAGSSFDLFKNYQDRGTQFKEIMQKL